MRIVRGSVLSVSMAVAVALVVAPGGGAAAPLLARPGGPNPFLSVGTDADVEAWKGYLTQQSALQAATALTAGNPIEVREAEAPGAVGQNDNRGSAEAVRGFGSRRGQNPNAVLRGQLSEDVDFYKVELRAGDVLGVKLVGDPSRVTIFDPAGVEVQGSAQDFSVLYPAASPLPRGGKAIADHVASVGGTHYVAVSVGTGGYEVGVQVHRPALQREARPQFVFLDFNGAQVDSGIFGFDPGLRTLSPFSSFLANWGFTAADEPALVRQIAKTVRENLVEDIANRGNNPRTRLVILNSVDHPDLFGQTNVSRVVIGGTRDELTIPTVGIAQSIDPGNFAHEETAVVLQDLLSLPAGPSISLNTYLTPESNKIEFVGRAIGNIVTHEMGHYLGSWHTDNANAAINLMDAGGGAGVLGMFGVGPDRIGGNADDIDTDLIADAYFPAEEFTGVEDTLNRTAFGLSGFTGDH